MKRVLLVLALIAGLIGLTPADAFWQSRDSNYNVSIAASGGTVTLDAANYTYNSAGGLQTISTTLTVGTNSNRALCAVLSVAQVLTDVVTVTWVVGGTTQIFSVINSTSVANVALGDNRGFIYCILQPTSGAGTLTASWTVTYDNAITLGAISFNNVKQTGGTTSFPNATTATASTGATTSLPITTATGNMVIDVADEPSNTLSYPGAPPPIVFFIEDGASSYETNSFAFGWTVQYAPQLWYEAGLAIAHN